MPLEVVDLKPSNAGWTSKVTVDPSGNGKVVSPMSKSVKALFERLHPFSDVEIAWYPNKRIKITLKDGAPAVIRQSYLRGHKDVIVELAPDPDEVLDEGE